MTKKGSFIGGWVGVGQLLVAVRQTVQCIKRIFVIKSFKMAYFTNVYGIRVRCGEWQRGQVQILYREKFPDRVVSNSKTFTPTVQRLRDTGKFHPRTEDRSRDRSQRMGWLNQKYRQDLRI
jgi:hypothetical protein